MLTIHCFILFTVTPEEAPAEDMFGDFDASPTELEQALEALAEVASDDLLNPQGIRPAWFDTV